MQFKYIALSIILSVSLCAKTDAQRGTFISADGYVVTTTQNQKGRTYPYGSLLSPVIGYTQNTDGKNIAVNGLEKYFDNELKPQFMTNSKEANVVKGMDLKLNIPIALQTKVEAIADDFKKKLQADEIIAVVMESKTGKVISMATTARFDPKNTARINQETLKNHAVEYSFEPGSAMKPITFAILLDNGLVDPKEMVNGHNGKFELGRKTIVDEYKWKSLSAENVIVHSSNIGIAQLAQRLNGQQFNKGLSRFGFSHFSGIDLPYERGGSIPTSVQLDNYLYKAITSYGYGISATPVQMVKAYNVFNNNGKMIEPKVVNSLVHTNGTIESIRSRDPIQVVSPATAKRMKQILIKTVMEGTATVAQTPGLEIGGKTGTAHIAKNGVYTNSYMTSFVGFANDATHGYTIGITVVEPRANYFASITAVPVFKGIVDMMVRKGCLIPKM